MLGGLGPMLMSTDISKCLEVLCADSNLPLIKLAELQDHRVGGVMTPLIERSETVADALRVVLMFNCRHAEPLYWTGSIRGDHAALTAWFDRPAELSISQADRICILGVLQAVSGFKSALGEAFQPTLIRIKPCWSETEWPTHFMGVPIEKTRQRPNCCWRVPACPHPIRFGATFTRRPSWSLSGSAIRRTPRRHCLPVAGSGASPHGQLRSHPIGGEAQLRQAYAAAAF